MAEALTLEAPKKKTRATYYRDQVQIRIAANGAGPLIAEVLKENGIDFNVEWSEVSGHWLIACIGDEVVGCLMVVPAKPIGLLEFLFVKPGLGAKFKAIALQKLALQGCATLMEYGSSFMSCTVDVTNRPFFNVLEKYGCQAATNTVVMVKRLKGLQ